MRRNMVGRYSGMTAVLLLLWFFPAHIVWAEDTAMFELGNDLLQEGNYSEAMSAYETFVNRNPEHRLAPAAMWTMANISVTINGEYDRAAELLERIVSENPDTEWEFLAYDRLGSCFEEQEKWEETAKAYDLARRKLSSSSQDVATQARVGRLKRKLLSSYDNMQDHESTILLYQEILEENPAAPSAAEDQFGLAQAYVDMKKLKEAAENFVLVIERHPASNYAERVQSERTDLLVSQCDYDWAPFSTFQSARSLRQIGQYEEALAKFDEVIEAKRNTGMAYGARFQKQFIQYQKDGDVTNFRKTLASGPDDYPYGFGGVPVDQLNYFLSMIAEAQEALASNPEDVGAYVRMGWGYHQTQAHHVGIDSLKKAISIAPDVPNLYNMLGYCYIGAQEYDEAVSSFQKLIDVAPEDPNSYDSMAEGYHSIGDTAMAIQFYQKSLAIDSSFSNPYYMLGRIYQELDQKEKAVKHLERYLELDPGGFQAQSAENLLNQLNLSSSGDNEP